MSIFTGSAVAIVTPFNEDYSVNYEQLDVLIEEQIAEGTDAIVICGTTGEAATMTMKEHKAVVRHCIETVNKRVPVIAGTGSNDTAAAIKLSKQAEEDGADGLLIVTPYYNKATQKGLIKHFTTIAEAVSLPIILYNVPSRTGVNILPETAAYLAKNVENIVAIKAASGNISQIAKTIALCGDDLDVYSGDDDQTLAIMALGGKGVISVLANVAPKYTHELCQKMLDGDLAGAREMQLNAIDMIGALFCEVNPIPVKTAMNLMGKNCGPLRLPMCEMEPANEEKVRQQLVKFGLL